MTYDIEQCNAHCKLHTVQCMPHTSHLNCTLITVHWKLCWANVHCKLYTAHCKLYIANSTLYTSNWICQMYNTVHYSVQTAHFEVIAYCPLHISHCTFCKMCIVHNAMYTALHIAHFRMQTPHWTLQSAHWTLQVM